LVALINKDNKFCIGKQTLSQREMVETPWLESTDVKELSAEPFEILAKFKYDNLIKFSNIFLRIGLCKLETYNQKASGQI
jgi:hypothetical protein